MFEVHVYPIIYQFSPGHGSGTPGIMGSEKPGGGSIDSVKLSDVVGSGTSHETRPALINPASPLPVSAPSLLSTAQTSLDRHIPRKGRPLESARHTEWQISPGTQSLLLAEGLYLYCNLTLWGRLRV